MSWGERRARKREEKAARNEEKAAKQRAEWQAAGIVFKAHGYGGDKNLRREITLYAIVQDLRTKGATFEHYDNLPEVTREGDVHVMGEIRGVWFKDPDGNILSLVNTTM